VGGNVVILGHDTSRDRQQGGSTMGVFVAIVSYLTILAGEGMTPSTWDDSLAVAVTPRLLHPGRGEISAPPPAGHPQGAPQ
jgi:hypothetical protein